MTSMKKLRFSSHQRARARCLKGHKALLEHRRPKYISLTKIQKYHITSQISSKKRRFMRISTYHSGRDGTKKPSLKKNKDITKDHNIKVFPSILSIKFLYMWQFSNLKLSSRTCHSETLVYRFHHSTTHQLYGL